MSEQEQAEKCIEIAKKAMELKDWSKVSIVHPYFEI